MAYENAATALREEYTFNDATFGATTVAHNMIGPKGCTGFVRDIVVDVTTTLVGTTTVPEIDVGTASGDPTYGRYRLGTAAGTGFATGIHRAGQEATIVGNPPRNSQLYTNFVVLDGFPYSATVGVGWAGRIPADTAFVITSKAGTGGSPAGGGIVRVIIDWIGQNVA